MKVKICGLSRPEDIEAVNAARPDYCGFIINFPKSRRNVTWEQAAWLSARLAPGIIPVGVFVDQSTALIAELLQGGVISVAQLHGRESNDEIDALHEMTGGASVWQAFQVRSAEDMERAKESHADLVLLDAGQGGGTAFDWSLLGKMERPFALAGGLHAGNIPEALQTDAVLLDVSSGAETGGYKDPEKIKTIVSMIKGAE